MSKRGRAICLRPCQTQGAPEAIDIVQSVPVDGEVHNAPDPHGVQLSVFF